MYLSSADAPVKEVDHITHLPDLASPASSSARILLFFLTLNNLSLSLSSFSLDTPLTFPSLPSPSISLCASLNAPPAPSGSATLPTSSLAIPNARSTHVLYRFAASCCVAAAIDALSGAGIPRPMAVAIDCCCSAASAVRAGEEDGARGVRREGRTRDKEEEGDDEEWASEFPRDDDGLGEAVRRESKLSIWLSAVVSCATLGRACGLDSMVEGAGDKRFVGTRYPAITPATSERTLRRTSRFASNFKKTGEQETNVGTTWQGERVREAKYAGELDCGAHGYISVRVLTSAE